MSYRPSTHTEYMFKIVHVNCVTGMRTGPYASFTYRNDRGWHAPISGKLYPCHNGYHLIRLNDLPNWISSNLPRYSYRLFLVKVDMKDAIISDTKIVARNFRFVCELETSDEFVGCALSTRYFFGCKAAKYPNKLRGLAKKWGLDMKDGKVVGEYV